MRKWVQRYQRYGEQGLHDLPTAPNVTPEKPNPTPSSACCNSTQKPTTDANALPDTSPSKAYNGRVERRPRTDDEEFYLPCVLSLDTVEAFLRTSLGWLYHYNYARAHSGCGMEGRTPYGCCVALGFGGSEYVGVMPVVLLGTIVLDWSRQGVPAVNEC